MPSNPPPLERGEVRLVAISRDEVENGTYVSISERFDAGITEMDLFAAGRVVDGPSDDCGCGICSLDRKLRSAFQPVPNQ